MIAPAIPAGRARHYWGALVAIVAREWLRFLNQRGRFLAALVRPLVWLLVFAAGFRAALGLSITRPTRPISSTRPISFPASAA